MRALILRPPATLRQRPAAGQPELEQGLLPSFQMNQLRVAADELDLSIHPDTYTHGAAGDMLGGLQKCWQCTGVCA